MKLTSTLYRQHLGRMFARHWKVQGQKRIIETSVAKELIDRNIPIYDPKAVLKEKKEFEFIEIRTLKPKPVIYDENHPMYKERVCHMYRDHNVLLEGLDQAKLITKTVEIDSGLPQNFIRDEKSKHHQDELVQRSILSAHLLDAAQVKLPRIHDPSRPAWKFPVVLGIPDYRRNQLMSSKLLQLCESMTGGSKNRFLIWDSIVTVPIEKDTDLLQFELTADALLMSAHALPTIQENAKDVSLPDVTPVKHTITLEKEHYYELNSIFPVANKFHTVHTALFHYNSTQVKNIYETPVTETQIFGRTLMKTFAVAAAQARQKYGDDVADLPNPISIQSIHTDGQFYHFVVFQLNTLNLDGINGTKNIMWMTPKMELFTSCKYEEGKPVLSGYNPEVFKTLLAFYHNGLQ